MSWHVISWSKSSFRISTKFQLPNLDQTSGSKCWPNLSFSVLTKNMLQNLYQTSASKSTVHPWPHFIISTSPKHRFMLKLPLLPHSAQDCQIARTPSARFSDYGRPLLVGWSMTSDNTSMNTDRNEITEAAMSWEWLFSICQEQEPDQFGSDCRKGYFWGEVSWTYLTKGSFNSGKPDQFDGSQDRLKLFFQSAIPSLLKIWWGWET